MAVELRNESAIMALKVLFPFLRIKEIQASALLGLSFRARFRVHPDENKKRVKAYWMIRKANDSRKDMHK